MDNTNRLASVFLIIVGINLLSCGQDTEALVQTKVAERVNAYRAKRIADCESALLAKAEKMADSLLILDAVNALNDSLARSRPGRPFHPPAIPPIDSAPVKPLFDH